MRTYVLNALWLFDIWSELSSRYVVKVEVEVSTCDGKKNNHKKYKVLSFINVESVNILHNTTQLFLIT
jgi:hypothetical protein